MAWLTPEDLHLWNEGTYYEAYRKLGAHVRPEGGVQFTVWAPHANYVSVVGELNDWDSARDPLEPIGGGLWTAHVVHAKAGDGYKYRVGAPGGFEADKTDPFAFAMEAPRPDGDPHAGMASIVTELGGYGWNDAGWMASRKGPSGLGEPMAVYEVHLGSWRRHPDRDGDGGRAYTYREIAAPLAEHAVAMGFTHVELLPVMEHPYYGSWGYQVTGFYAATHRYGSPHDLMYLIDTLHAAGVGVILDWVPAHFAMDPQALGNFDGQPVYEAADPLMRTHPDWGTYVFDYESPGVRSFLVSNALFWLDHYHADGLRVDAVASMLYRDYSRGDAWTPNRYGGRENIGAIELLQAVNREVFARFPEAITAAEESTSWPGVTRPVDQGGLGFLYKWNMGWMHDTLAFMGEDPVNRRWHHKSFTFPLVYAFSEQYVLPLSHDEVVHLKRSLVDKMPGDAWQQAANLRLLLGHMIGHPGKKLLFMGMEFGQRSEWNHDDEIEWWRLGGSYHQALARWTQDALGLYRAHPALHDDGPNGFRWLTTGEGTDGAIYERYGGGKTLTFAFNFTPAPRENVRIGAMPEATYRQVLTSDDLRYGGSGAGTFGPIPSHPAPAHGYPGSIVVTLPPLGVAVFERE